MALFKSRKQKEELIKPTITILDADTNEEIEIVDVLDPEVEAIILKDAGMIPALTDMEMEDMTMGKSVRDAYPDMKDRNKFVMDACMAHKSNLDAAAKPLNDEDLKNEKGKIDNLVDEAGLKKLHDAEMLKLEAEDKRQQAIIDAELAKHKAAQMRE